MKAYLSRRYHLSAAHRLFSPTYTDQQNQAVFGKCANPHGHGHNYVVEVTVAGQVDPVTGMVCNLTDLDRCVQHWVIDRFDHMNLNVDEAFQTIVPTTENLCIAIHHLLDKHIAFAALERVRVEETSNNFFEYARKGTHGTPVSHS